MHALFEEAGKFQAGRILSEADSSAQIELDSGKRVKVKAANVLLKFEKPSPPEMLAKARERGAEIPDEVAFLLAKKMRSNVRDLEGALNTLAARANFTGRAISVEFAQETLRDLLRAQQQAISIPNIQKTVADYYGLQMKDLLGKKRTRSLARPRQVAMAMTKELTEHSLPEIGDAFGGRDHTTVLHACRQIRTLMETDGKLREDWDKLIRKLSE